MISLRHLGLLTILVCICAGAVLAQEEDARRLYEEGQSALAAGDHKAAAEKFIASGDALAAANAVKAQTIYITAGKMFRQAGLPEDALAALQKASSVNKDEKTSPLFLLDDELSAAHQAMGNHREAASAAERALGAPGDKEALACANLHARAADSYLRLELYSASVGHANDAYSFFLSHDPAAAAKQLVIRASAKLGLGDFDGADEDLQTAWAMHEKHGDVRNHSEILSNQGLLSVYRSDYEEALKKFSLAQRLEKTAGLNENLGADLNNEGLVWRALGNYDKAMAAFSGALELAQGLALPRDEGIALSNRAIIHRIQGNFTDSLEDYKQATQCFEKAGSKYGMANVELGMAKLVTASDRDYTKAWAHATKALSLFSEIGDVRGEVESRNIMAFLIKEGNSASSGTRDLLIEEEPSKHLGMPPSEALGKIRELLGASLEVAERLGDTENIWECHQGLGYADWKSGELDAALEHYRKAIESLAAVRSRASSKELSGSYLKNKQDVFAEALAVASELNKTRPSNDLGKLILSWSDMMLNEVMKSGMGRARMRYENKEKEGLRAKVDELAERRSSVDRALQSNREKTERGAKGSEGQSVEGLMTEEGKALGETLAKLDKEYALGVQEWKQQHPEDRDLYDTLSELDPSLVQKSLASDEAVLNCMPLPDGKSIALTLITSAGTTTLVSSVPEKYGTLANLVVNRFLNDSLERGGRNLNKPEELQKLNTSPEKCHQEIVGLLHDLYLILYEPLRAQLTGGGVKRLRVVAYKDLAYVPFCALKKSPDPGVQDYLVYDHVFTYTRLKYLDGSKTDPSGLLSGEFLGVANPIHKWTIFPPLGGAMTEIDQVSSAAKGGAISELSVYKETEALEETVRAGLARNPSVVYLATHGYPYPDYYAQFVEGKKNKKGNWKKEVQDMDRFQEHANLNGLGFLGGYLLLACQAEDYSAVGPQNDGLLTLKDIMEIECGAPELVVLSACNSAVEFAPKLTQQERSALAAIRERLVDCGWQPGIDQVAFPDAFLRKGTAAVLGTQWFVDDNATQQIVGEYFTIRGTYGDAEALQRAMISYIEAKKVSGDTIGRHPYYWAPFTLTTRN